MDAMNPATAYQPSYRELDASHGTGVMMADRLKRSDLEDLCRATQAAITEGEDVNWRHSPGESALEAYWKGAMMAPHRELFVARLDGRICGALQMVRPSTLNDVGAFAVKLSKLFIAPFARGYGLSHDLIACAEAAARAEGFRAIDVEVRADRTRALQLVERLGYEQWAVKPHFAIVDGQFIAGHFFTKMLDARAGGGDA